MLFNSYIFIFLFLPLTLYGYFWINQKAKIEYGQLFLLMASLLFYGWMNWKYVFIIFGSICINFCFYSLFKKNTSKYLLEVGVLFNVLLLFWFKYFNFFIENINLFIRKGILKFEIALPLGISFFTFQQISFLVDAYNRETEIWNIRFIDYASFVAFFPQLIAGPIVKHSEIIPQFLDKTKKRINIEYICKGIYIFIIGLAKKVIIADTFGKIVEWGYGNYLELDTTNAVLVVLGYTMQLYFDFSGYCDMAMGIAKMFNIDIPLNFDSPYKSVTIDEFWDKWHITLKRFLAKYIYIPLGGNKNGKIRSYINVMVVFLVSGIWHGAGWGFLIWGCLHGFFTCISKCAAVQIKRLPAMLNWMFTFAIINVLWIFFRAENLGVAWEITRALFSFSFGRINYNIVNVFNTEELYFLNSIHYNLTPKVCLILFYLVSLLIILKFKNSVELMTEFSPKLYNMVFITICFIWSVISLTGVSAFLYFNF